LTVLRYLLHRLLLAIATMFCVVVILFCVDYVLPGDPTAVALGPLATPAMKAEIAARMGLDQPVPLQFVHFLRHVLTGDLGRDVFADRPVAVLIGEALPRTIALTAVGLGWAVLLGVPLGCLSAVYRDSWFDRFGGALCIAFVAIPSFVIALYALLLFAKTLNWLPAIGAGAPGDPIDQLRHLVLPSLAIGLGWVGYLGRFVRSSMLDVLAENHVRTARAYGVPERRVIFRFALRLAVLPTVALLGISMGQLLSGAVFAEIVFARPGVGKLIYDAVITRNYPVVNGTVLVTTALLIACTLAADVIAAWLDPRVRVEC
jgi:peptide/nickel transport system permease protein